MSSIKEDKNERRTPRIQDSSKWKFRVSDRLVVQRLLPVMDGNTLKMLFLFDVIQKVRRVRYWYMSDLEIATATGMRMKQVQKALHKLVDLNLIDYRLHRSGAVYRWHRNCGSIRD